MGALRRQLVATVGALVFAYAVEAAENPAPPAGSNVVASANNNDWAAVARWPEFMGGVWGTNFGVDGPEESRGQPAPKYKAGVEDAAKKAAAEPSRDGSYNSCTPHGIPTDVGGEFFFTKGAIFLMQDLDYLVVRRIDMLRKEHGDPELTYYGDSLGHWEGKTLVVDTTGFLPEVPIAPGIPGNSKTQLIERYKMIGPDKIELEITVNNPELLEEPYVSTRTLTRHPDWSVHETYCRQDNPAAAKVSAPAAPAPAAPAPAPTPGSAP